MSTKSNITIVTGLSGAGMSSALAALQDFGFEVFDNFPLPLVGALAQEDFRTEKPMAIGIDTRTRGFSQETLLESVKKNKAQLIYMDCDEDVLQRRFTETRRRHPQAENQPVRVGIEKERALFGSVKKHADLVIDTTNFNIHDLRHFLKGHFNIETDTLLTVTVMSFSFKKGVPREADIVMDVRFLQNPHWIPELKPKTGQDKDVANYVAEDVAFEPFIDHFKNLLEVALPRYAKEGKSYLTIAIGCTGGRHRSVFTTEYLGNWLKRSNVHSYIEHRDLRA